MALLDWLRGKKKAVTLEEVAKSDLGGLGMEELLRLHGEAHTVPNHVAHVVLQEEIARRGLVHIEEADDILREPVEKASQADVTRLIEEALRAQYGENAWVHALESIPSSGSFVFQADGKTYRATYEIEQGAARVSEPVEVTQEWLPVVKAEGDALNLPVRIVKADGERGNYYGVAGQADDAAIALWKAAGEPKDAAPAVVDTQGDWYSEDTLLQMAEQYLSKGKLTIGLQHNGKLAGATVLQSAVVCKGTCWPEPTSPPIETAKAWVFAVHTDDAEVRKAAKEGELTGFSIGGRGERVSE